MIVKDKERTLNVAHEIGTKVLQLITKEVKSYNFEDDPAENFYLMLHIAANISGCLLNSLRVYSETYSIPLPEKELERWFMLLVEEYIKIFSEKNK